MRIVCWRLLVFATMCFLFEVLFECFTTRGRTESENAVALKTVQSTLNKFLRFISLAVGGLVVQFS